MQRRHAVQERADYGAQVSRTIKAEMARRDQTQTDLAMVLGLSQAGVSRRLKGHTDWTLTDLVIVAEWLGMPLGDLLPRGGSQPVGYGLGGPRVFGGFVPDPLGLVA